MLRLIRWFACCSQMHNIGGICCGHAYMCMHVYLCTCVYVHACLQNNMGILFMKLKQYSEAEAVLRAAFSTRYKLLDPHDPEVWGAAQNLGWCLLE